MTGCEHGPDVLECYGTRNGEIHCCFNCSERQDPTNCRRKLPVCYKYLCLAMKKKVVKDKALLDEYGELCKKALVIECSIFL